MQGKTWLAALYPGSPGGRALSAAEPARSGWLGVGVGSRSLARGVVAVTRGASFGKCIGDLVASGADVRAFVHDGHVPSRARLQFLKWIESVDRLCLHCMTPAAEPDVELFASHVHRLDG